MVLTYSTISRILRPKAAIIFLISVVKFIRSEIPVLTLRFFLKRKFYTENINTERNVLFEAETEGGMRYGFTDNYIKVAIPEQEELWNTIQTVFLEEVSDFGYAKGSIVSEILV